MGFKFWDSDVDLRRVILLCYDLAFSNITSFLMFKFRSQPQISYLTSAKTHNDLAALAIRKLRVKYVVNALPSLVMGDVYEFKRHIECSTGSIWFSMCNPKPGIETGGTSWVPIVIFFIRDRQCIVFCCFVSSHFHNDLLFVSHFYNTGRVL
jgi:hypothetical protein